MSPNGPGTVGAPWTLRPTSRRRPPALATAWPLPSSVVFWVSRRAILTPRDDRTCSRAACTCWRIGPSGVVLVPRTMPSWVIWAGIPPTVTPETSREASAVRLPLASSVIFEVEWMAPMRMRPPTSFTPDSVESAWTTSLPSVIRWSVVDDALPITATDGSSWSSWIGMSGMASMAGRPRMRRLPMTACVVEASAAAWARARMASAEMGSVGLPSCTDPIVDLSGALASAVTVSG
jgi:hypothetical protein